MKVFKNILITILVLLSLGASYGTFLYSKLNFKKDIDGSGATPEATIKSIDEPVNILIAGVDVGDPDEVGAPQRTDTIMIAHYDPKMDKMTLVSVPRDTKTSITNPYSGYKYKMTELHAIGDKQKSGIMYLEEELEKLLNIEINAYVKLDYEGFKKIVDNLGGVNVTVPHRMEYDDPGQNLHIRFTKGDNLTLDGQKALEFFRWRQNNPGVPNETDGSDLSRIYNQSIFINAVVDKVATPAIIAKLPSLVKTSTELIYTNIDSDDILVYAMNFAKLGTDKLEIKKLDGDTPPYSNGEPSYFVYMPEKNKDIQAILRGQVYMDTSKKKVKIINSSGINGLASRLQNILVNEYSYDTENIILATGEESDNPSSMQVYNTDTVYDRTLKDAFLIEKLTHTKTKLVDEADGSEYDIVVNIGKDMKERLDKFTPN